MQISLLGCGWLGLPLAKLLAGQGYTIKGSTTSADKLAVLQSAGIQPFHIDLNNPDANVLHSFLEGSSVLIIAIPPKVKADSAISYPDKIKSLLPFIAKAGIDKVLFTSSTSVYADDESIPVITEETVANPDTESGRQVLAAEEVLRDAAFKATITRLGGLMGPDRHPVVHLAGRQGLQNPEAPVNMASQHHILAIILKIIQRDAWGETFVITDLEHPTRQSFYSGEAKKRGLPLPEFETINAPKGKLVNGGAKIMRLLDYHF